MRHLGLALVRGKRASARCDPWRQNESWTANATCPSLATASGAQRYYCGTSLDAGFEDILHWRGTPTNYDALNSYIINRRVTHNEHLLITQPYSPHLFRQGVLPGPDLLHKVLARRIEPEDAQPAWRRIELIKTIISRGGKLQQTIRPSTPWAISKRDRGQATSSIAQRCGSLYPPSSSSGTKTHHH